MPAFQYNALNTEGKETKGILEGDSARQIRQQLRQQGLTPLSVDSIDKPFATHRQFQWKKERFTNTDLALVTRQMATLVQAAMPLEEILRVVAKQSEKKSQQQLLLAIRAKVLEGHSFAKALADFPNEFPTMYRASIAAGEESGHLDVVLNSLADYTEKQQQVRSKISHALIYPSIMVIASISIVTFLLIYVMPKMIGVFSDSGQRLPLVTQILLNLSYLLSEYGWVLLLVIIATTVAFKQAIKNEAFRTRIHEWLLSLPLIGNTIKTVNTARFARTFGILSSAGVPVLRAINISAELVTNIPMRAALKLAADRVKEGAPINHALKQTQYFPPMSIHIIASGESSGHLEQMLQRAADTQDWQVTMLIEKVLALFEPMTILIMGAVVLFIVLAILLPIFELNQLIV